MTRVWEVFNYGVLSRLRTWRRDFEQQRLQKNEADSDTLLASVYGWAVAILSFLERKVTTGRLKGKKTGRKGLLAPLESPPAHHLLPHFTGVPPPFPFGPTMLFP